MGHYQLPAFLFGDANSRPLPLLSDNGGFQVGHRQLNPQPEIPSHRVLAALPRVFTAAYFRPFDFWRLLVCSGAYAGEFAIRYHNRLRCLTDLYSDQLLDEVFPGGYFSGCSSRWKKLRDFRIPFLWDIDARGTQLYPVASSLLIWPSACGTFGKLYVL